MNKREVGELRRRFKPDRNAIGHIYGCYVSPSREIVADIDESLALMHQEEAEQYLGLLKKTLSGTLGRNLIDIVFSTRQVAGSEEHGLLMALRKSELKDNQARQEFYRKVIGSLDMDGSSYLILLAHDAYDVPYRGKDDEDQADASDQVFKYIICCICPVKDGKLALSYVPSENEFHNFLPSQVVAPPELGFLFPAFDDRAANIYSALAYAHKPDELHQEFLDAIFHTEPPMSAGEQREAFQSALYQSMSGECSLEMVQAVHGELLERIERHKESRDPEPLAISVREAGGILRECGADEEQVAEFCEKCGEQFGEDAALSPGNIIQTGRFEVKTSGATITVPPEQSRLVETRMLDGKRYLLIPVGEGLEVNGLEVDWES